MEPRFPAEIERALRAVGELLTAERAEVGIIVVGGTALNLLGIVERTTRDVDVLAIVRAKPRREMSCLPRRTPCLNRCGEPSRPSRAISASPSSG